MISMSTDFKNAKTVVSVEDSRLELPGIVQQFVEFSTCYVILMGDWEMNHCPDNNIYAIGKDGEVQWNIRDVLFEQLGSQKDMWYPQMDVTPEGLSVLSFSGIRYLIDVEQGVCLGKHMVK